MKLCKLICDKIQLAHVEVYKLIYAVLSDPSWNSTKVSSLLLPVICHVSILPRFPSCLLCSLFCAGQSLPSSVLLFKFSARGTDATWLECQSLPSCTLRKEWSVECPISFLRSTQVQQKNNGCFFTWYSDTKDTKEAKKQKKEHSQCWFHKYLGVPSAFASCLLTLPTTHAYKSQACQS